MPPTMAADWKSVLPWQRRVACGETCQRLVDIVPLSLPQGLPGPVRYQHWKLVMQRRREAPTEGRGWLNQLAGPELPIAPKVLLTFATGIADRNRTKGPERLYVCQIQQRTRTETEGFGGVDATICSTCRGPKPLDISVALCDAAAMSVNLCT